MREAICINVGQAGIQMGHSLWELFCLEHGISPDGQPWANNQNFPGLDKECFFENTSNGRLVPRCLMVDTEPTVVDEIRVGHYRDLFHSDRLINGNEDASNCYARGRLYAGKPVMDSLHKVLQRAAENCDSMQGFIIMNSSGGGTGSGLTGLLMKYIHEYYSKLSIVQSNVFPGKKLSTSTIDSYNTVLATPDSIDESDLTLLSDNESMYKMCHRLTCHSPNYTHINRIFAQVFNSFCAPLYYKNSMGANLCQIQTNFTPYPRIHFASATYAPLMPQGTEQYHFKSSKELVRELFVNHNRFLNVNFTKGKYMCCFINFRGPVNLHEVNQYVNSLRAEPSPANADAAAGDDEDDDKLIISHKDEKEVNFVDWCPTGFKLGTTFQPPIFVPNCGLATVPTNAVMLCNNTSIYRAWNGVRRTFDVLFKKRAFLHWYLSEGMEEYEFVNARDEVETLGRDYNMIDENVAMEYPRKKKSAHPKTVGWGQLSRYLSNSSMSTETTVTDSLQSDEMSEDSSWKADIQRHTSVNAAGNRVLNFMTSPVHKDGSDKKKRKTTLKKKEAFSPVVENCCHDNSELVALEGEDQTTKTKRRGKSPTNKSKVNRCTHDNNEGENQRNKTNRKGNSPTNKAKVVHCCPDNKGMATTPKSQFGKGISPTRIYSNGKIRSTTSHESRKSDEFDKESLRSRLENSQKTRKNN